MMDVIGLNKKGLGVIEQDGKLILARGSYPGDKVEGRIVKKKKHFLLRDVEVKEKGPRTKAFCPSFGKCGGCLMQDFPYELQLQTKKDMLTRLFPNTEILDVVPSETRFYRNRMDFSFFPDGLGMHKRGSWKHYENLSECQIFSEDMPELFSLIKGWQKKHGLSGFDINSKEGLLRYAVVREAKNSSDRMLVLTVSEEISKEVLLDLFSSFGSLVSSFYVSVYDGLADVSMGDCEFVAGKEFIIESLLGEEFKVFPQTFFQTNTKQAEKLFSRLREVVSEFGSDEVWDLYGGIGTISRLIDAKRVHCVEEVPVPSAILPSNVVMVNGKVEDELLSLPDPSLVIIDPPRSGLHPKVRKFLSSVKAPIVYVSCNPSTLKQDVSELTNHSLLRVEPFDLFPHTMHVECLAVLLPK